jgi:hypothetical protein
MAYDRLERFQPGDIVVCLQESFLAPWVKKGVEYPVLSYRTRILAVTVMALAISTITHVIWLSGCIRTTSQSGDRTAKRPS